MSKPCEQTAYANSLAGSRSVWTEAKLKVDSLTMRERQVLNLISGGLSNKEIGVVLNCSHRTIEIHRGRMMQKLVAKSGAHAGCIAVYAALAENVTAEG